MLAGCGVAAGPSPTGSLVSFPLFAFPIPADNQPTAERVELGRLLFADPILSGNRRVACGSCHRPEHGMGDGKPVGAALGDPDGGDLTRASMTIYNVRFQHSQFWDGRAESLEALVSGPIENPRELASSVPAALAALGEVPAYRQRFTAAYGSLDESALRRAIAAFLRSVTANDAPVDRYLAGESTALSPAARAGFDLFFGKARCSRCHYLPLFAGTEGPSFTNTEFRVTGVPERGAQPPRLTADLGRAGIDGDADLAHAFKAPTLRNIAHTAPYMHNGAFDTLEQVVDFYDRGAGPGQGYPVPNLDFVMQKGPLGLTADDKAHLLAFLREGLTDLSSVPQTPTAVPSGLPPSP